MSGERDLGGRRPPGGPAVRRACSYVLPLRWHDEHDLADLTTYLELLSTLVDDVVVVDGSSHELFEAHAHAWASLVRHVPPDAWEFLNGKVAGVRTGVLLARHEPVVIADDDVRYDGATLDAVMGELARADLVGPQNVLEPAPWHARWDTGRSLLNRALGHDHPGTFGLRRSTFLRMGGYDGDVLFENLELARTVQAAGGEVRMPLGLYVPRRPPTVRHFLGQRVRQAYDDLAEPARLGAELAVLPAALLAAWRRPGLLAVAAAAVVLLAEAGRRLAGGRRVYPATAALWAPLWLGERAVCVWLAVGAWARGGVRYGGRRLRVAAHSSAWIRVRLPEVGGAPAGAGPVDALARVEADAGVRPVAEGLEG